MRWQTAELYSLIKTADSDLTISEFLRFFPAHAFKLHTRSVPLQRSKKKEKKKKEIGIGSLEPRSVNPAKQRALVSDSCLPGEVGNTG